MSEQNNNNQKLISIIDGEQYEHKTEWEKIKYEKTNAMYNILKGLNVFQVKQILDDFNYTIDSNSILS